MLLLCFCFCCFSTGASVVLWFLCFCRSLVPVLLWSFGSCASAVLWLKHFLWFLFICNSVILVLFVVLSLCGSCAFCGSVALWFLCFLWFCRSVVLVLSVVLQFLCVGTIWHQAGCLRTIYFFLPLCGFWCLCICSLVVPVLSKFYGSLLLVILWFLCHCYLANFLC